MDPFHGIFLGRNRARVEHKTRGWWFHCFSCSPGSVWRCSNLTCAYFSNGLKLNHQLEQGSLNYPCWGNQTIQIYGDFEGFPSFLVHCLGWCHIMVPVNLQLEDYAATWMSQEVGKGSVSGVITPLGPLYPIYNL